MSCTTKLSLKTDTARVERRASDRVPGCAALWVRIMVIVAKVSSSVVVPTCIGIDETCWIQALNEVSELKLRVWLSSQLSPSLIVYDP